MTNCSIAVHFLLLLAPLLSLLFVISSAQLPTDQGTKLPKGFVSIDCGSSTSSYTDENSIEWVGDDLYIKNGENHQVVVPPELKIPPGLENITRLLSTLRVFSTGIKNCYSIDGNGTERVLVRATFFYGNYDNKSTPPTFDLHFNGNHWTRVTTSSDKIRLHQAVFAVKGNTISVCVARTQPGHIPFISALEVRSLDMGVYGHSDSNYPLYVFGHFDYGGTKIIRFPEDVYDRLWVPSVPLVNVKEVTSDSLSLTLDNVEDNPPKSVIQTGMILSNRTIPRFDIFLFNLTDRPAQKIYINVYFSEMYKLSSTEKRSFSILINDELLKDAPIIIPPYGSALEMHISAVTLFSNITVVSLVSTPDSTLPPLINAMEVFTVAEKMTEGTNPKDVNALAKLQGNFIQLQDWSGDPCLPSPYTWDWVDCSSDPESPRITALHLGNFGLVGILPDFSEMDALQAIDLHNNSLAQRIPDFLGNFPQLKELNLADNNFSGTVPSSLSRYANLNVSGNPNLCFSCVDIRTVHPLSSGNNKLKSTNYMLRIPIILGTLVFFMCFGPVCAT